MSDGTKDIRGVNPHPPTRDPRQIGRKEVAGSTFEIIGHGKYPDGQDRMGTAPNAEHRDARTQRYADGEALRAGQRSAPRGK
jgi:hypothetical protein